MRHEKETATLEHYAEQRLAELTGAQILRRLGMISHDEEMQARSRERMPLTFLPCPICGEVEHLTAEAVYRIDHDYSKHGLERLAQKYEVGS